MPDPQDRMKPLEKRWKKTEESRVKSLNDVYHLRTTIWMKCYFTVCLLPLNESFKRILDSFRIFESTFDCRQQFLGNY